MSFSQYSDDPGRASYHAGAAAVQLLGNGIGRDSSSEFTRLTQSASSNVQKITSNVSQVQRMVNQLGTAQDTHELRDKLHQMQHYTNQLAKDTNKYLKDLSNLPNPSSQSEQRQRKMQRDRLTNDFSTALNNFQTVQRRAAEKERESVSRARANSGLPPVSNASTSPNPFDDDVRTGDGQLIALDGRVKTSDALKVTDQQGVLPTDQGGSSMTAQMMEEESNLEMIRERETNIRQLEADIMDVNSIFKDLATMVHEQGEMIDSIEANVENAAIHVESGNQQLRQASDYQKKSRRKLCIILIVGLIALGIIGLIIYLSVR
ncbi:syntaxin-7-like isoform X2 [Branchiostoma lanceolatum]|uniref:syntaxin-7-like isoform X2 n=1 Tax=Branchiostoma lanceolatum TaxID=7740 RepID=UPI0034522CD9